MSSVTLTGNFLATARCLTFAAGNGASWSFDQNTNELTISAGGGNVLGSVGLTDDSTAPIYTIGNSPLTSNGTLTITLNTQTANYGFYGPASGAAAQPGFRAQVIADLPTGIPNANLANASVTVTAGTNMSGGGSVALGSSVTLNCSLAAANPTGKVGTSAADGTATTFMRSDAAPPIDLTITPTWTGAHNFAASGVTPITSTVSSSGQWAILATDGTHIGGVFVGGSAIQIGTYSNHPLQFIVNNGGPQLTIATSGAITATSTFAINNGTPTTALSGFGSPSGTVTSGLSSSSTLAQTAGTLAALLAYLKTIGFIAA